MIKKSSTKEGTILSTHESETISINSWLHLGASAFFRAHQAYYLNELNAHNWKIHLANLRNSASQQTLQALQAQQGDYTLEIISPEGDFEYKKITALNDIILWDVGLASTIKVGVAKETKIISFTVTEGGYFLTDDGRLDLEHPCVVSDLNNEGEMQTLYGTITQILLGRMYNNSGAISLLCCDNLRNNGESFLQGLNDFIDAKNFPELKQWVKHHVCAPNSMVDRITPKFEESIFKRIAQKNIKDDVPLSCEKFTRWVIQDSFITERPLLEQVGVEFVDDVAPYEEAKIRLLNASHSGLAWAGALNNKTYINETLSTHIVSIIKNYAQNDVGFALQQHGINIDTVSECNTILNRFKNPYVKDTVARISSDSIAKLSGFIVPTLKDCFEQNKMPTSSLKLAGLYFFFLKKYNQNQLPFEYEDCALSQLNVKEIFSASNPIHAFATSKILFGSLCDCQKFCDSLEQTIKDLKE